MIDAFIGSLDHDEYCALVLNTTLVEIVDVGGYTYEFRENVDGSKFVVDEYNGRIYTGITSFAKFRAQLMSEMEKDQQNDS